MEVEVEIEAEEFKAWVERGARVNVVQDEYENEDGKSNEQLDVDKVSRVHDGRKWKE